MRGTVAGVARCEGRGLHSNAPGRVTIRPAPPGTGRGFRVAGPRGPVWIPARVEYVVGTTRSTRLAGQGASVDTVEHVLAALVGLGVDDAVIEVDGPELPILDGSARGFVDAIEAAGGVTTAALSVDELIVDAPIEVSCGDRWARLEPAPRLELQLEVDYRVVGAQSLELAVDVGTFRRELAAARTFGFVDEAEALWAAGRARGAGLDCALVYGPDRVVSPEGPRWPDEVVRHKALDVLGDLALAGARIRGAYRGRRPGHALTVELVRRLRGGRPARPRSPGL